jgi:uncharacterized protein YbjT (DUF2867 family)
MRITVFGATGPTGGHLIDHALAADMLAQFMDGRVVHKAIGVVTTQVRPSIAKVIWTEATRKRY